MTTDVLAVTALEAAKAELRSELRIKLNTDYAVITKGGKVRVLCCQVYEDSIREVFERHSVVIDTLHTYD